MVMVKSGGIGGNGGRRDVVPNPDPTRLTTEQSNALREEMHREIGNLDTLISARLDSSERFFKFGQTLIELEERISAKLIENGANLLRMNEEKFTSISQQFRERDVRTELAASTIKTGLDTAILAQEKLYGAQNIANAAALKKSEDGFNKEIDGLKILLNQGLNAINDKISALASRVDRGEGGIGGATIQRNDQRASSGQMMQFGGLVFTGITILIAAATLALTLHAH
jgi:hypothetical protein